ncbi:uncharacterized protein LOC117337942 [Pecten maximus]|uniref:uncharacterized protein LOC117337942 n=1 Tax=Pecten maximus TaxID=6579 RepID=UPI0014580D58|nr:uncharacterized protein LOC117337942 [Pecten maximus]
MKFLLLLVVGVCLSAAVSGQAAGTGSNILTDAANAVNSVSNTLAGSQTWNIPQQGGVQSGTLWSAPGAAGQFNTAGAAGAFQNTQQLFPGAQAGLNGLGANGAFQNTQLFSGAQAGLTNGAFQNTQILSGAQGFPGTTAGMGVPGSVPTFSTASSFLPGATAQTFTTVDPGFNNGLTPFAAPNQNLITMGSPVVPFSSSNALIPGAINPGFSTFDSGFSAGVPLNPVSVGQVFGNPTPNVFGSAMPVTGVSNIAFNSQPMTTFFNQAPMLNTVPFEMNNAPMIDYSFGANMPYNNFAPANMASNMYTMPTFDSMPTFGMDPMAFNQGIMGTGNDDNKAYCIPLSSLTPQLLQQLQGKK